jgi:DNA-directed RNA polymerase subunit RPC12/RpoP
MSETKYSCADCRRPMAQDESGAIDMTDHAADCAGIARFVIRVHEDAA